LLNGGLWVGLVQEMDYELEAKNTMVFKENMKDLQGVTVARVYPELTARKVIVTDWIVVSHCVLQVGVWCVIVCCRLEFGQSLWQTELCLRQLFMPMWQLYGSR
jgi:hypothetical protein